MGPDSICRTIGTCGKRRRAKRRTRSYHPSNRHSTASTHSTTCKRNPIERQPPPRAHRRKREGENGISDGGRLLIGTEALRTTAIGFAALAMGLTWLALRTAAIPVNAPERLVAELRLAQIAALLLALAAGAYVGIAVAHEARPGVGLDIALAIGFFIVAATT